VYLFVCSLQKVEEKVFLEVGRKGEEEEEYEAG
jgi:hypothetical protein